MNGERRPRLAGAARRVKSAPRPNPFERRMSTFLREPSVRTAASVIVVATALVVGAGGVLIWLLDHKEYPNVWLGLWWALQTVTTVGYGDVTPTSVSGRLVGALVMLEGTAIVAIMTAAITSAFISRAERERTERTERIEELEEIEEIASAVGEGGTAPEAIEARLDRLDRRLERIESLLRDLDRR